MTQQDTDLKQLRRIAKDAPEKRSPGEAERSYSTHQARASWFRAREAWPLREVPVESLTQARSQSVASLPPHPISATWSQAGPTNVGGRTTSIVVDPGDPQRIWVGAAGGGVWSTDDGGASWATQWHSEPSLNIGSLCLDPNDSDTIYCGTGEANLSADSHPGVGVYRSIDGGASWILLAPARALGLPRRIGRVVVDPFDSQHLFAAGVGHRADDPQGIFESRDGGVGWAPVQSLFPGSVRCHEVLFHPTVRDTVFVAIDAQGASTGIYRSRDGGVSWQHLTAGLPHPSTMSRISLALAPSEPNVLYAQCADRSSPVPGIFRSVTDGDNWKNIGGNHFAQERQMTYNNTIAVDPSDANRVICGGVDLHLTKNGGKTWTQVTKWHVRRGDADYAHADQHQVMFHPNVADLVYAVNDGGLDVSTDGGKTWTNRSAGLATNMFYDLASAASVVGMYGGGMQDNGTWLTLDGNPDNFVTLTGGDGGFAAIDPTNPLHLYTSSQRMRINRFLTDRWRGDIGPNETGPRPWMAFIAMDPSRPKRVYVGSTRVWRTTNDGNNWKDVTSGPLDGSFVTCIEISRADPDRIYCGTENGGVFVSHNGGTTWSGNMASSVLPGLTITRLRTTAQDADVVYATTANFGRSHLWRTVDGAVTWSDVDGGALPDVPHHGIVIPSGDPDTIIVSSDVGVHLSQNATTSWTGLTLNLPTVMVIDIVLHEASKTLLAATYGRSTWSLDISRI